ncbi:HDOD domain-containing protein [Pseudoalteromonas sp. JBTF-M23]|uniref:HDOD domain-containing protein n=1 Tax=Pseudoalteromonas caenipelagi TaxID=2726988 RepID=A0A849V8N1_9GAMM|nr:HDOD domain-containing protein [Pseudoalteromonas caenipelagi]NOU49692.1 HDOD domain-containing protein [Pseudoalteromonas caenipelagi]
MINIDDKIIKDIKRGFNLPPKPELLERLQSELQQPEPELNQIAQLIATDLSTSAAVLKVINSPTYGMSRTITDIKQAVMFLGLDSVTQLVTGCLLQQAFEQTKCCISLERFWDTSSEIAAISTLIGKKVKSKVPSENLHMLGLFHDAGIPAMAVKYPDYVKLLNEANNNDASLIALEGKVYNTSHTVVGFYLASSWHLPKQICQLILRHHDTEFLFEPHDQESLISYATLKMAENLVHTQKRFVSTPDWPLVKNEVLNVLEIDEDDYQDILEDTQDYFQERFG